jgi:hypothetical protein
MDLISLAKILSDDKRSFDYLLDKLTDTSCPFCHRKKHYVMNRKRLQCRKCRSDYNPLTGSKFSLVNLPSPRRVYADSDIITTRLCSHGTGISTYHQKRFSRGQIYINGIEDLVLRQGGIAKYGVSPKFLYHIKEMEWRYNNMYRELFDLIVNYMLGANHTYSSNFTL